MGFVESGGRRLIILIGAVGILERCLQRESIILSIIPSHHHLEWKRHRRLRKDLHRQSKTVAAVHRKGHLLRLVVGLEVANPIGQIVPVIAKSVTSLRRTTSFLRFIHRLNLWHQLLHQTIRRLQRLLMAWLLRRDHHRPGSTQPQTILLQLVLRTGEQRQKLQLCRNLSVTIRAIVGQADFVLPTRQKVILRYLSAQTAIMVATIPALFDLEILGRRRGLLVIELPARKLMAVEGRHRIGKFVKSMVLRQTAAFVTLTAEQHQAMRK